MLAYQSKPNSGTISGQIGLIPSLRATQKALLAIPTATSAVILIPNPAVMMVTLRIVTPGTATPVIATPIMATLMMTTLVALALMAVALMAATLMMAIIENQ